MTQPIISGVKKFLPKGEGIFWVLIWYGKSFYNRSDQSFHQELIFRRVSSNKNMNSYNFENDYRVSSAKLDKCMILPLFSVYRSDGSLFSNLSTSDSSQTIARISNKDVYYDTEILDFILAADQKATEDYLSTPVKYFKITKLNHRDVNEKDKVVTLEYFIPMFLIPQYFVSKKFVHSMTLIENNRHLMFRGIVNNTGVVIFNNRHITTAEVESVAHFLFTKSGSGERMLRDLRSNFLNALHNKNPNVYYGSQFPLDAEYDLNVDTILLKEDQLTDKISRKYFLVTSINDATVQNETEYYSVGSFNVIPISPENKKNKSTDEPKRETKIVGTEDSKKIELSDEDLPYNPLSRPVEISTLTQQKYNSPFNVKVEMDDKIIDELSKKYVGSIVNDKLTDSEESSSSSTSKKIDRLPISTQEKSQISLYKFMEAALEKRNAKLQFLGYNSDDGFHSSVKIVYRNRPIIDKTVILCQIQYNNKYYCLIDFHEGFYIALIRFEVEERPFHNDFSVVLDLIKYTAREYKLSWSSLQGDNFLISNSLHLFTPIKHVNPEKFPTLEGRAEKLVEKIFDERIMRDNKST